MANTAVRLLSRQEHKSDVYRVSLSEEIYTSNEWER